MNTRSPAKQFASKPKFALSIALLMATMNVFAAPADLAPAPLVTSPTASVLPNVFLMMDDSGSMAWDYMPDNAGNFNTNTYGAASGQCNGMFYDPTITYTPPVTSIGASYANSTFTAASTDGYNTAAGSTNLSTSFVDTGNDTAQTAFYYQYSGTQTTQKLKDYYNSASTFYQECINTTGTIAGNGSNVFTKIILSSTVSTTATATIVIAGTSSTSISGIKLNGTQIMSAATAASTSSSTLAASIATQINARGLYAATASASTVTITGLPATASSLLITKGNTGTMTLTSTISQPANATTQQNFANWYSYYRTRIMMMKTATGLAFQTIGSNFRVGMATMNNNTGTDFLALAPFTAAQKASWYTKLYATTAGNSTPLREALAFVGIMYAHKLPAAAPAGINSNLNSSVPDPIEYACQQNFTILTTDGFWNGSTTYDLALNPVGNQDGAEIRPMYDGAAQSSQAVTTTVTTTNSQSVQNTSTNTPWTKTTTTLGGACSTPAVVPSNTISAYMSDNGHYMALGLSAFNPDSSNRCSQLGTGNAWFCRGGNGSYPAVSSSMVTDSNGITWYLDRNVSANSGCTSNSSLWGGSYSSSKGACPGTAGVSGTTVTTQNQSYTQTVAGTTTTVTQTPTTLISTVVTTNGVAAAPVTSTSTGTPVVTSTSTAVTSDSGAPGAGTTWTSSSVTACMAPPPAAGTVGPSAGAPTVTYSGTATVTPLGSTSLTTGPVITTSSSGGTFDTLADVAEYYYVTDLRSAALGNNLSGAPGAVNGTDISANVVPSSGLDKAANQHMTTFTLGLGARGRMVFDPSYQSATTGDFFAVAQGSTANSTSGICSWQGNNTACNWPIPASNAIENVDDLWHTAVNGRGAYFSAGNPADLSIALSGALAGVSARLGSSAAATTSTAFITQGDNFLFRSSFVSLQWTGDLIRQQLDVNTGAILPTIDWSAQTKLDTNTTRNVMFFNSASTTNLSPFLWANLSATQQSYFNLGKIQLLTQSCAVGVTCLSAASQTLAAGANLVNYIAGDRTNEGALADNTKYYRQRIHVLGDIVDSETVYVSNKGMASFTDQGYSAFTGSTVVTTRKAEVYVGSNDGMLHAFRASDDPATPLVNEGGQEDWAYIPTMLMSNLYKLADKNYSLNHQYYVDGSPAVSDICFRNCATAGATDWKTILVGGLNNGGMGYYALDITDPANPKALWEFTDPVGGHMGYSYGNPKIVKLKNGTWVVVISSGYNNVPPYNTTGDGMGHLYVLNANSGALITDIVTSAGSALTPSNLGRIDVPVASPGIDATSIAAYGGDMLGNVWRFDINGADTQTPARWIDIGAAGFDAQLFATLFDASGIAQPITSKPLITLVGTTLVVNVGTGRYLGSSDLSNTNQQSFYAMKDTFAAGTTSTVPIYANPRSLTTQFVKQTQTATACTTAMSVTGVCSAGQSVVTTSNTAVDFTTQSGWFFDFVRAGERNNTDATIMQGTILLTTNVPNTSSCSVGGDSYLYQLNYRNGGSVSSSTAGVSAVKLSNEISSRPVVAQLSDGTSRAYVQGSGGGTPTVSSVWKNNNPTGIGRRVSWRELTP